MKSTSYAGSLHHPHPPHHHLLASHHLHEYSITLKRLAFVPYVYNHNDNTFIYIKHLYSALSRKLLRVRAVSCYPGNHTNRYPTVLSWLSKVDSFLLSSTILLGYETTLIILRCRPIHL